MSDVEHFLRAEKIPNLLRSCCFAVNLSQTVVAGAELRFGKEFVRVHKT